MEFFDFLRIRRLLILPLVVLLVLLALFILLGRSSFYAPFTYTVF